MHYIASIHIFKLYIWLNVVLIVVINVEAGQGRADRERNEIGARKGREEG